MQPGRVREHSEQVAGGVQTLLIRFGVMAETGGRQLGRRRIT
jgi:hypothetical protein